MNSRSNRSRCSVILVLLDGRRYEAAIPSPSWRVSPYKDRWTGTSPDDGCALVSLSGPPFETETPFDEMFSTRVFAYEWLLKTSLSCHSRSTSFLKLPAVSASLSVGPRMKRDQDVRRGSIRAPSRSPLWRQTSNVGTTLHDTRPHPDRLSCGAVTFRPPMSLQLDQCRPNVFFCGRHV